MDQAPRVLVTGATGLLGRAVCREFQNNNWLVIGIGFRRARPGVLRCDLTDEDAVRGLLQDYKVVILEVFFIHLIHQVLRCSFELVCCSLMWSSIVLLRGVQMLWRGTLKRL